MTELSNKRLKINGLQLLDMVEENAVKCVFFDPQYRGVLDYLSYGNEGVSRGKERSSLPQMDEETIKSFLHKINKIMMPSAYLFLWIDKFHLVDGIKPWFTDFTDMKFVDMIVWDKGKIGMGYRTRRKSEYLVVIQKEPYKAKSTWKFHDIPDVWIEKIEGKEHTHQKPVMLQKKLIECVTDENDLVMDPASGSFSVFNACQMCNRNFIGGDLVYGTVENIF